MNKTDQLFIRACKSKEPRKRVCSVYRRFYNRDAPPEIHVIGTLARICDEYVPAKTATLIYDLHPSQAWRHCEGVYDYNEACFNMLVSRIRLSTVKNFTGLTRPLKFRRDMEIVT